MKDYKIYRCILTDPTYNIKEGQLIVVDKYFSGVINDEYYKQVSYHKINNVEEILDNKKDVTEYDKLLSEGINNFSDNNKAKPFVEICIEYPFSIDSIYGLEVDQILDLGWEEINVVNNNRYESIFDNAKVFRKNGFLLRTIYGYLNGKIISSDIVIFNDFGERFFYGECPNKETLSQLEELIKIN